MYKTVGDAGGGGGGGAAAGAAAAAAGGDKGGGTSSALGGLLTATTAQKLLGFGGGNAGILGMAGAFSLASMAGLGFEHVLTTALGLAASLAGAISGGLILAVTAAGVAFVGMGSDMLVMKSTIADTKTLNTALTALNTAVIQYGAGSTQAAAAQTALNTQVQLLGNTAGVAAELALAKSLQATNKFWDQATSGARVAAVGILSQFVNIANQYIPLVANAAQRNFTIIGTAIHPLIDFLAGPGKQIFTDLENVFARNLPTAVSALTQGFELFFKIIDQLAPSVGGVMTAINNFLTTANSASGFPHTMAVVDMLVGLFHTWWDFMKIFAKDILAFFQLTAGLGSGIITALTGMLTQLHTWLGLTTTQTTLSNLFYLHKQEILQILQILPALLTGLGTVYLTVAPALIGALTGVLGAITPILTAITSNAWGAWAVGLTIILGKLGLLMTALGLLKAGAALIFGINTAATAASATSAKTGILGLGAGIQKVFVTNYAMIGASSGIGSAVGGAAGAATGEAGGVLAGVSGSALVGSNAELAMMAATAAAVPVGVIAAAVVGSVGIASLINKVLGINMVSSAEFNDVMKKIKAINPAVAKSPLDNVATLLVQPNKESVIAAEAAAQAAKATAAAMVVAQGLAQDHVKITGPLFDSFALSLSKIAKTGANMSLVEGTIYDAINHAGMSTPGQVTTFLATWARLGLTGEQSNNAYAAIDAAIRNGSITNPQQVQDYLGNWGALVQATGATNASAAQMALFTGLATDNSKQFNSDIQKLAWTFGVSVLTIEQAWGNSAAYSNAIANDMRNLKNSMPSSLHVTTGALATSARGGTIKGFASGGDPLPGFSWVGEEGPELAAFPNGAHIYPHAQSMAMTSGKGGGGDQTVIIDLRGTTVMSAGDVDVLVDKIGRRLATTLLPHAGVRLQRT